MMKLKSIVAASSILLLSGCATTSDSGFYWGNYSHTLYQVKKSSDENSIKKHMGELHAIIETSEKRNLKVPPGVFAELGQLYQNNNKQEDALGYYRKEITTYPESEQLISKMISSVEQ